MSEHFARAHACVCVRLFVRMRIGCRRMRRPRREIAKHLLTIRISGVSDICGRHMGLESVEDHDVGPSIVSVGDIFSIYTCICDFS